MSKRPRGRPKGSTGRATCLNPDQIKRVLKIARSERFADRAELLVSVSIDLGMRATELASLRWIDVYHSTGSVRSVITANRAFLPSKKSYFDLTEHSHLQRLLADFYEQQRHPVLFDDQTPLFQSQRGFLTATSIARYLTELYRRAGIPSGTSRSGRRTMVAKAKIP